MLALSACSSSPKKEAPVRSEQAYYSSAQAALKAKNYFLAVEHLRNIETHYPFGKYTAQAQLDLIYSHFQSGSYQSATATANRFIDQHPKHPQLDYAYYMSALASYDVDRGFLTRVLPTSPAQRSIKPVVDAFQAFKRLVSRFPDSEYAADAQQRMIYLRNILAEHELQVGQYYLTRGAHIAAINRGQYVLQHFPNSPSVPEAIALSAKAYLEMQMPEQAEQQLAVLRSAYPDYKELKNGKLKYVQLAQKQQRSWLNILTFGLVGNAGQ